MAREPVIPLHPMILPEAANPVQNAARECRREAARLREIGRDDLARVFERNAAEVAAMTTGVRK